MIEKSTEDYRKFIRDFRGRIEHMKTLSFETSISLFFDLCNFNINNFIKIEQERNPKKTIKEIMVSKFKE